MRQPRLIATQTALDEWVTSLDALDEIAIDTEFVRETTYFAELCLLQAAVPSGIHCVDYRASLDLSALHARLVQPDTTWVAHSARQDLEVFWHAAQSTPSRIIDTQIAAALVGHAPQVGLQEIVRELLGVELSKALTRTDWRKRPIGEKALAYAADDVRYLGPLRQKLTARLEALGRLEWLEEECRRLLSVQLEPDLETLYRRLKGAGRLRGAAVGAALALIDWREGRARRANRPRRWILADAAIVALAVKQPNSVAELQGLDGLSEKFIAKSGQALVDAIGRRNDARVSAVANAIVFAPAVDPTALKALQLRVARLARELGIEPEVIAPKRDLAAATIGNPPEYLLGGWRAETLDLSV